MRREQTEIQKQVIRVVYPTDGGRISLRTEENWDSSIEAHSIQQEGCISEFQIETERPYFYFKPVLLRDGTAMWSRGENFLAVTTSSALLEIHPYFREDAHCSVCELMPPLASASGAQHRFRVFLPPGYYENTLKKYPVLYMHDGHNLFFKEEAFVGNTWRTDEVLGMLEPLIDAKYRTLSGPTDTAVMGSSLGGVVSFYVGWQWPEVFGKVACLSSTFSYRDNLLERVSAEPKRKIRIYLDSGWPGDNYEATRSMRDRLIWKGYGPGSDLFYLAFPEAKHEENAWAARSPIPFQFLFGKLPAFGEANFRK